MDDSHDFDSLIGELRSHAFGRRSRWSKGRLPLDEFFDSKLSKGELAQAIHYAMSQGLKRWFTPELQALARTVAGDDPDDRILEGLGKERAEELFVHVLALDAARSPTKQEIFRIEGDVVRVTIDRFAIEHYDAEHYSDHFPGAIKELGGSLVWSDGEVYITRDKLDELKNLLMPDGMTESEATRTRVDEAWWIDVEEIAYDASWTHSDGDCGLYVVRPGRVLYIED